MLLFIVALEIIKNPTAVRLRILIESHLCKLRGTLRSRVLRVLRATKSDSGGTQRMHRYTVYFLKVRSSRPEEVQSRPDARAAHFMHVRWVVVRAPWGLLFLATRYTTKLGMLPSKQQFVL